VSTDASAVRVTGFDHLVLVVADVERSLEWYCGELGLTGERVEEWRRGDVLFPSLRIDEHTLIDLLAGERGGVNVDHLCLVIEPADLAALAASGRFDVVGDGPAGGLFGARGFAASLYVRDPDGDTVELRSYERTDDPSPEETSPEETSPEEKSAVEPSAK
jgi:catechol 2,3-dioxygenase-like lactoylglutathione lyase family enzyme